MHVATPLPEGALRTLPTRWWAALSFAAGAIHLAVVPEHLEEWWAFAFAFAALGLFQLAWPFVHRGRPSAGVAWTAVVVNLATVAVWAWSRTAGLPVGPEPGMPEPVGVLDLAATVLELALVAGLLVTSAIPRRLAR